MSERLSTIGMYLMYKVEDTTGERPTSGYTRISEVKSVPSLSNPPEGLETSTLENLVYKSYTPGLIDLGGAIEFTANLTADLLEEWNDVLISAYNTAVSEGKQVWFVVVHRKLERAVYFTGAPTPIGLPEASVNSVLETPLYITPDSEPTWYARPTDFAVPSVSTFSLMSDEDSMPLTRATKKNVGV